jgi:hypothetical protein
MRPVQSQSTGGKSTIESDLEGSARMRSANTYRAGIGRLLWEPVRLPILAFLVILEPIVSFLLGGLALLGILTTLFFKLIGAPHFPFWTMLAISMSFVALLAVYEALIKLLSKPIG